MHDDIASFHRNGYLGPMRLTQSAIFDKLRAGLQSLISARSPLSGHGSYARHLDSRNVFEVCTDPTILTILRRLVGPDILLWNSGFWMLRMGEVPTPWHQDLHYWPTVLTFTCWIAFTDTDESTGCLIVAPQSQTSIIPIIDSENAEPFEKVANPSEVSRWQRWPLPMSAGEFVILSDRILHTSAANVGVSERVGLAVRYTIPSVKVCSDRIPLFPGHYSIQVSGVDHFGINKIGPPPLGDENQE